MADHNRKSFTQKTRESLIPNEQKTLGERIKESVTDGIDSIKATLQPKETKGVPQQIADRRH